MIEVYEVESPTLAENEAQHLELLASLGLTGQMGLIAKEGNGTAINHYRAMDEADKRLVKALCPNECKLDEFDREVVPYRVLEIAANATKNGWFNELRVCYTDNNPDPFLVGIVTKEHKRYDGTTVMLEDKRFLIARWGDELMSWPDLLKRAKEIWKAENTASLKNAIVEATAKLESLESKADLFFMGRYVNI